MTSDNATCDTLQAGRDALLDRLAGLRDPANIAEAVTTALIETGADVDIPQNLRGVVEIQLYGIVVHGGDLRAACLAWRDAARAAQKADHGPLPSRRAAR